MFHVNSAGNITPPKFPNARLNMNSKKILLLCLDTPQNIIDIFHNSQ